MNLVNEQQQEIKTFAKHALEQISWISVRDHRVILRGAIADLLCPMLKGVLMGKDAGLELLRS